jgi:cellulose biosynthesis protein BcsQ
MASGRGRAADAPSVTDAIIATPSGLDIIPSNGRLSAAELVLVSAMNREAILANTLKPLADQYDYILIDCLPSLGLLAINALRAADGVVIPVQADFLAMQGLAQIIETIAAVREQLHPALAIYGVLLTMVDIRTGHSREVVRTVRSSLAGQVRVFETDVRLQVVLKETAKAGRSILDFDSNSPSAAAYRNLAYELMTVVGDAPAEPPVRGRTESPVASVPEPVVEPVLDEDEIEPASVVEPLVEAPVPVAAAPAAPSPASVVAAAWTSLAFEDFLEGREQWLGSGSR